VTAISLHSGNIIIMFACLTDIGVALIMVLKGRKPQEHVAQL
jgi:hypothetical protein